MSIDVNAAVAYNRRAASRVGWGSQFTEVIQFLREHTSHGRSHFPRGSPSQEDFALAIAEWQTEEPLAVDGKLGPKTWQRMSRRLDQPPEGFVVPWESGPLHGTLLTGFDFDRSDLKPAHVDWLSTFTKKLPTLSQSIFIVGMTDRSGASNYNRRLSHRRAQSVYRYLRSAAPTSFEARFQIVAAGEELAQASSERAASDRGVALVYAPAGQTVPTPGWFVEMLRPQPSRVFFIRSLGGYTMSASVPEVPTAGVSISQFGIEISDGFWSQLCWLEFASAIPFSISDSPNPLPVSGSLTVHGPWHIFRLPVEQTVRDFGLGTSVTIAKATVSLGVESFGPVKLTFHNPGFQLDPFLMGKAITLDLASAGGEVGGGELRRRSRWPIRSGVPDQVQRRLLNGVKPGPSTMAPVGAR